jgi:hypothetical protein
MAGARPPWRLHFVRLAPNVCGFSERIMLYVTLLAPRILRLFLDSWTTCATLLYTSCSEPNCYHLHRQVKHEKIPHSAHSVYLRVLYGSQRQNRNFSARINWWVYNKDGICLLRGTVCIWATSGLLRDSFTFTIFINSSRHYFNLNK